MSPELLASISGIVISLVFSYVPGLNTAFAALRQEYKRLIMAGLLLLTAGAVFGLGCSSWGAAWGIQLTCDQPGLQVIIAAFVAALISNQAAYSITPLPNAVKSARVSAILEDCQESPR
jgi:putative flippase GtrA